ncbi:hypothetical protein SB784_35135, partial [Burkholderia sp. SIMBA_048]
MLSAIFRRTRVVSVGIGMIVAALTSGMTVAQAQDANAVLIKNFMFSPMSTTIKAGSTVTWKNLD